jgi:chemotaxis protein CheD
MIALNSSVTPPPTELILAVGIGQCVVSTDPKVSLVSYGLGSCVGVAVFDSVAKVAGLLHILLPEPGNPEVSASPLRFATSGIPMLLREVEAKGGLRKRLRVVAAGGSQMLGPLSQTGSIKGIGLRNIEVVKRTLQDEQVILVASDFGGVVGRTMGIIVASGATWIRTAGGLSNNL